MEEQISNEECSQAIYDISLSIAFIKNLASQMTPHFNISIGFQIENSVDCPSPYQIIEQDKNWNSSITLQSYRVENIYLPPSQCKQIKEVCIFRGSMPIDWLESKQLTCYVEIETGDKNMGTLSNRFESTVGLCSYLPVLWSSLGIQIEAKIETQVLGIRIHKNCIHDSFETIYKGIQFIIQQNNRLTSKLKQLQNYISSNNNSTKQMIQNVEEDNQQSENKQKKQQERSNSQIYQQYCKIKEFKQPRIFKGNCKDEHRENLVCFLRKICCQYSKLLQWNWQKYLQNSINVKFMEAIDQLRQSFIQDFSSQLRNKILKNLPQKSQYKTYSLMVGKLKFQFQQFELLSYLVLDKSMTINESLYRNIELSERHLVVLVHGYGANSKSMGYIERIMKYLYPHIEVLNSKINQEVKKGEDNIQSMGRNLAMEVEQCMQRYGNIDDVDISFVGYSLGGLVVRAALVHLQAFKLNMNTFITLSTPHLGHISHINKLAKMGMMAYNVICHSNIIDNLLLKDNNDERLSYLYSLSIHSGLSWFKTINLYGSPNDGYVSLNSALVHGKNENFEYDSQITQQMSNNINELMSNSKISKYEIKFLHESDTKTDLMEWFLGRASHFAFTTNQEFIYCFLLLNNKCFKGNDNRIVSEVI